MIRLVFLALVLLSAPSRSEALGLPLPRLPATLPPPVQDRLDHTGQELRRLRERALLREHRRWLEADPRGAPVVRSEVVAIAPDPAALARARAAGFFPIRESTLTPLDLRVVVLRAPDGMRVRTALKRLARIDPEGHYDYNHLYLGSGDNVAGTSTHTARRPAAASGVRIGLVDGGVDAGHGLFSGATVTQWGCEGNHRPDGHGTAVASLLAGEGDELFAADIYCGRATGGAVTSLAEALAWLAGERVAVINLSLVGPPNRLLEILVQAMQQRGHVLVAAVGNDGPAARPLFPAAYPGVIGVTAVDAANRALPEAAQGDAVDFAAPGNGLWAAQPGQRRSQVRGTSFAAPLVARLAAAEATVPGPGTHEHVLQALAAKAQDLGRRGRDPRYGHGLLASETRTTWAPPVNED